MPSAKSGANAEYCEPYGVGFTLADFEQRLSELRERFASLRQAVLNCPWTSEPMGRQYLELFHRVIVQRRALHRSRAIPGKSVCWWTGRLIRRLRGAMLRGARVCFGSFAGSRG